MGKRSARFVALHAAAIERALVPQRKKALIKELNDRRKLHEIRRLPAFFALRQFG